MLLARRPRAGLVLLATTMLPLACSGKDAATPAATSAATPTVTKAPFGTAPGGAAVDVYTLTNSNGIRARSITYGAIVQTLEAHDRNGQLGDVELGFDDMKGYEGNSPYFGAIVGRYGNRIARGRFTIDGHEYTLATNDGPNHLHGGLKGFDKVVWTGEPFHTDTSAGVVLGYTSRDMEEGYPGTLQVRVTYALTNANELAIAYHATTDKATPVNLTNHTYWNLAGDGTRDILDHQLQLEADSMTPVDSTLIPTGEIRSVAGTPFDFRTATAIGARIGADDQQIRYGRGYDHNFVLTRNGATGLAHAAHVTEPTTGRTLDVYTTEPGVQFYSGNFLDGTVTGKHGHVYRHRYGFALETQHYPDSPNHANFPSTILRPGGVYDTRTVFRLGVER
jgi:aldose 1-epimerase